MNEITKILLVIAFFLAGWSCDGLADDNDKQSSLICLEKTYTKIQEESCLQLQLAGLNVELQYYYSLGVKRKKGKFTKELIFLQNKWQQESQKCANNLCLLEYGRKYRFELMRIAYGGRLRFDLIEDMSDGVCPYVTAELNKIKDFPYPMVDEGDADGIHIKGIDFIKFTEIPPEYKEDVFRKSFLSGWGNYEERKQVLIKQLQQGLFRVEYDNSNVFNSDFVGLGRYIYNKNIVLSLGNRVQRVDGAVFPVFKNHFFQTRRNVYVQVSTGAFKYKNRVYIYGVNSAPISVRALNGSSVFGYLVVSYVNYWINSDESLLSINNSAIRSDVVCNIEIK